MKNTELAWDKDGPIREHFLEHLAPVALFTYNRLEHTRKTIEALQRNIYAKYTPLVIFSDAPKREAAQLQVEKLRNYIHTISGFKSVEIIEREKNWGLAKNIIEGVTCLSKEYGRVIVVEDDIVTSPYFLKFMNDALTLYEKEPRVMLISGFDYPMETSDLPEAFFMKMGSCWGWATWNRSWQYFERNPEKYLNEFTEDDIYHFNFEGRSSNRWKQVVANAEGRLNTWAIFQEAMIYKQNGLALFPRESLVKNIGFDGTGEHCGGSLLENMHVSEYRSMSR